jgi:hypothetical protein
MGVRVPQGLVQSGGDLKKMLWLLAFVGFLAWETRRSF